MVTKSNELVSIPAGITLHYAHGTLTLTKGSKTISKELGTPEVKIDVKGQDVHIAPVDEKRLTIAVLRSIAAHIRNMIRGLEKGYTYKLSIVHSHFPMNVKVKGDQVEIANYLGEKNPRLSRIIGKDTKVEIKAKDITVTGTNLEHVSQTAANMEKATRDPKKDQRTFQDGIYITVKGVDA